MPNIYDFVVIPVSTSMPFVYRVSTVDLYFKVISCNCMTAKQKVKYFKSASNQNELKQINQFISNPKINATGIASSKFGIILLYEES
jgi:hypothetical protein